MDCRTKAQAEAGKIIMIKKQPSCANLNRDIAREIFGHVDKIWINPQGDKLIHWYGKGVYLGLGPEPPGNWSRHIQESFELLARWCWTLHTCDAGYRCQIHKAPERGEDLLGEGVSDSPMKAICIAVLTAHRACSVLPPSEQWK